MDKTKEDIDELKDQIKSVDQAINDGFNKITEIENDYKKHKQKKDKNVLEKRSLEKDIENVTKRLNSDKENIERYEGDIDDFNREKEKLDYDK